MAFASAASNCPGRGTGCDRPPASDIRLRPPCRPSTPGRLLITLPQTENCGSAGGSVDQCLQVAAAARDEHDDRRGARPACHGNGRRAPRIRRWRSHRSGITVSPWRSCRTCCTFGRLRRDAYDHADAAIEGAQHLGSAIRPARCSHANTAGSCPGSRAESGAAVVGQDARIFSVRPPR